VALSIVEPFNYFCHILLFLRGIKENGREVMRFARS
jgi:hypothetical protein